MWRTLVLFVAASCVVPAPVLAAEPAAAEPVTSRFVPLAPMRLADTRVEPCTCSRPAPGTIRVSIDNVVVLPDVVAAAITVTTVNNLSAGYATAYPAGESRPDTSTLNMRPGAATSNSTIIPVGADGSIDVYTQVSADIVVDVTGVFVASSGSRAGRFRAVGPTRVLDTRDTPVGALAPGESVTAPLPGGVPSDATAIAVNVTSVNAPASGFVTAFAAGTPAPPTSFVNPDGSGAAQAASVLVPVSSAGLTVLSSAGGDVVVDLVGWFTGDSAPSSTEGLFVSMPLNRLLDTRALAPRVWPTGTLEIPLPVVAAAIVTNVTMARPDDAGFVTAFPAGTPRPSTSSINAAARDRIVANLAITAVSTRGSAYFSNAGTDLVVDMSGYFTGTPVDAVLGVAPNTVPHPRVLLIGDSTLGALNVVPAAQTALRGFVPVVDAEPCRRLVRPSCKSAYTNRVPNTAVETVEATPGPIDIVVIRAGYNDGSVGFPAAVDAVVRTARSRGARWVIWLTYSNGTGNQIATYDHHNSTLRQLAASGSYPELVVADWRGFAAGTGGWYASDQVHLMRNGAWATADYITRWVASIVRRSCPLPWSPAAAPFDPCPSPDATRAVSGTPDLRGLYGL